MSEIRANTLTNAAGSGPAVLTGQQAAKATLNFDHATGPTVRASFNVSSVTDFAVGLFDVNLTNAMSSVNYPYAAASGQPSSGAVNFALGRTTGSSSAPRFRCQAANGNEIDVDDHGLALFGGLA